VPQDYTETKAAIIAGAQAAKLADRMVTIEGVPLILTNGDQAAKVPQDLLRAIYARGAAPNRKRGTSVHHQLDSFTAHVNRNKTAASALWANVDETEVIAIYNYHGAEAGDAAGGPGWADFRATYSMPTSDAWKFWTEAAGRTYRQEEFADLIESRMEDLTGTGKDGFPAPTELLEMSRSLRIHTQGTFRRSLNPTTGESELVCKTEHTQDSTNIPRAFALGIPVFRGGTAYRVECRIRFRLASGAALFEFTLHRQEEIVLDAFAEAVGMIDGACEDVPVFWGVPESRKALDPDDSPPF